MKAFKTMLKVLTAIVAIAGVVAGIYLIIRKVTGDKKVAAYYDDDDFFDCDCDVCDVIDCDEDVVEEIANDLIEEAKVEVKAAKEITKNAKKSK